MKINRRNYELKEKDDYEKQRRILLEKNCFIKIESESGKVYYRGVDVRGYWVVDDTGVRVCDEWFCFRGKWYYCHNDGYLAKNEMIDGYRIGDDGTWIYNMFGDQSKTSGFGWINFSYEWSKSAHFQKIDGLWYFFSDEEDIGTVLSQDVAV